MFENSNITSGEVIVKSTLFCKVCYVLYSGIKLETTFGQQKAIIWSTMFHFWKPHITSEVINGELKFSP
jgi:hypothetical protein